MAEYTGPPASSPGEVSVSPEDGAAAGDSLSLSDSFPDEPSDGELRRLRSLLFQREIAFIERLNARITDPRAQAEDVAAVIAEALIMRAGKDDQLSMAMEPLVDNIVRDALHSSPEQFTNALFPLMGPAIRKSISESFRSMLDSFSKSMEISFSWKGLRWRLEAMRSGKPFSEVVLLHTLVYRVEEIYFIHSLTGLAIMHVVDEGVEAQDASMVSAMLTAIQDFVKDCLVSGKEEQLDSLQHGEHVFLVERQPEAYLACIVRGTPPADFRDRLRACLEVLTVEYSAQLTHFSGDSAPFASCRPRLEKLLTSRFVDEDRPLPFWIKGLVALIVAGMIGGLGFWGYQRHQAGLRLQQIERQRVAIERQRAAEEERLRVFHESRWAAVDRLRQEPGLIVVRVDPRDEDPWEVSCLKDSLARNPEEVLAEHFAEPLEFAFSITPFMSLDPGIVHQRVNQAIRPPENVSMRFEDGVLYLSGSAPMEWILEARQTAMALPGVGRVDVRELSDPRLEELVGMTRLVEETVVEFPSGKDTPIPEDMPKLIRAVDTLADLEKLAARMGMAASLTIYGHADATGRDKLNYEISQARAKTIAAMLYARGASMPVAIYGMGADYASGDGADQTSRRIEMRVHLARAETVLMEEIRQ
jgi:OOP family OmpA-OmpF porin